MQTWQGQSQGRPPQAKQQIRRYASFHLHQGLSVREYDIPRKPDRLWRMKIVKIMHLRLHWATECCLAFFSGR